MKILTVNAHSVLNSGDAAIISAQLNFLDSRFGNNEHILVSRTPEIDAPFYDGRVKKMIRAMPPAPSLYSNAAHQWRRILAAVLDCRENMDFLSALKNCDVVISSGGGYFWTHRKYIPGPMFFQNFLPVKLAELMRKPVIFFPQSFGPLYAAAAGKMLAHLLMNHNVVKIFPREKYSHAALMGLIKQPWARKRIELCPDMAFLLRKETIPATGDLIYPRREPLVALTLRQWDFPRSQSKSQKAASKKSYSAALELFCRRAYRAYNASFLIFPQARGPGRFENDRIVSRLFFNRLKKSIPENCLHYIDLPDAAAPERIIHLLAQADFAVTTRFHSAVFAFIAGTPAIPIVYQPKARGIMHMLGMEKYCLDIQNLNADEIFSQAEDVLDKKDSLQRDMTLRLDSIRNTIDAKISRVWERLGPS